MAERLTPSGRPRVFLLDGMALAYRAHFAMIRSPLQTAKGQPTSAVFGFLAAVDRILETEQPEEIVVVFDGQEDTFRHRDYAEYKATRQKMPDEMVPQLAWIRRAVEGLGIPFLLLEGYEADDVIGTLARRESAAGKDVWIVSGDKDMLQLVDEHVRLYNVLRTNAEDVELVGPADVEPRFGVPADRVIDVLGLMGDASDNVPGVPGVGPKTAARLVLEHGSLEKVLEAVDSVPEKKLQENLREHAESARLSKRLVTIDVNVPIGTPSLARTASDVEGLRALYQELELRARLEKLEAAAPRGTAETAYHVARTKEEVLRLAEALLATRETGGFVLDTETTGTDPLTAELVGLSFAWAEHEGWYVPLNSDPPLFGGEAYEPEERTSLFATGKKSGDTEAVLAALRRPLEDASIPKTGQNAKYDLHVLRQHGVAVQGIAFDTMIADWLCDPSQRLHNIDDMALRRLGIRKTPTESILGKGKRQQQVSMRDVPIDEVGRYACEDADVTLRLRHAIEPELCEKGVDRVFREVEMPLLPVLARMEATGVRVDVGRLAAISRVLQSRIAAAEEGIRRHCGDATNIRSNAALGAFLFDGLELHKKAGRGKPRKTAKGTGYATDEETLQELAAHHPLPGLILEYRALTKLQSTYLDALPTYVNPATGRVHTTFNPIGAATGRLASSDPNLQNIPIRTEEGRSIRSAFVPEAGWKFLSVDYSQIELRLLAHLSGDQGLIEAFRSGEDIHRSTAARIFHVAPEDVTPVLRGRAKAVNFGVVYGMGPQRLARETKVSMEEARGFIADYFTTYPGVRAWLDRTVDDARRDGYVTTLLGRRRYLPELRSGDAMVQAQARSVAMNTPLQGTAADLVKLAMIRVDRRLVGEGWRSRMLVQIHDELLFESPPDELDRLKEMAVAEMSSAMTLAVPVVVDAGVGDSWAESH